MVITWFQYGYNMAISIIRGYGDVPLSSAPGVAAKKVCAGCVPKFAARGVRGPDRARCAGCARGMKIAQLRRLCASPLLLLLLLLGAAGCCCCCFCCCCRCCCWLLLLVCARCAPGVRLVCASNDNNNNDNNNNKNNNKITIIVVMEIRRLSVDPQRVGPPR